MSARLKDWWTGGGFFTVATILVSVGITWGATVATVRADQSNNIANFAALSRQLDEVKAQIGGVRGAQDGVLKLSGELSSLAQRVTSIEIDYKTQIQINAAVQADIARLQSDADYLRRN